MHLSVFSYLHANAPALKAMSLRRSCDRDATAPVLATASSFNVQIRGHAEAFRLSSLRPGGSAASSVARDLEEGAEEIGRENSLPSAASDDWR